MTKSPRVPHDRAVFYLSLAGGAPAVLTALGLLWWGGDYTPKVQWTLSALAVLTWLGFAAAVRERVVRPLQTLSNLLAALREGDFSIRARGTGEDALGLALAEVNLLSEPLRVQRLGALEAAALLRRVMTEIDVAVFAFDEEQRLRVTNRAGERLLAQPAERLLGRRADEMGLAECLHGDRQRIMEATFPAAAGRFDLRRSTFRQDGRPHQLVVLSDLSRTLREEERQVWQRLVRVLSHEINNSLAPIRSIAGSLQRLLSREERPSDADEDVRRGLAVIGTRSESLARFMSAYARLARLPAPRLAPLDVGEWVRRVATLEDRLTVDVEPGPSAEIDADGDQLDQLLINLVKNAVDAAIETAGGVRVGWRLTAQQLEVLVEDDGPGLPDTANLFVPFFTTKRQGTGIGLVLSRQIAEAHGGSLALANRPGGTGCVATLRLPAR